MMHSRSAIGRRAVLGGLAGAAAAPAVVSAEGTYPNRPVRYINPYPAGGPTDTLSRLFCAKMTELTGQQWIVENRGGAGGNVGMDALAKSDPDGYSLGLGGIAAHAIAPTLYARLPFNAHSDFTFVSTLWWLPNLLAVNLDVPAKSVPELIEVCRQNPGKYSYGSAGSGTTLHLSGELFKMLAKVDIQHVPAGDAGSVGRPDPHDVRQHPRHADAVARRQGAAAWRRLGQAHRRGAGDPDHRRDPARLRHRVVDHALWPRETAARRHGAPVGALEEGARKRRREGQVRRPRLDGVVANAS